MDLNVAVLYIALLACAGGIVSALLGWLDSGEAFVPRKFMASVVRALVAGVVFAVGYSFANGISILDLFVAFLGGAGIDVLGNRISGSIVHRT